MYPQGRERVPVVVCAWWRQDGKMALLSVSRPSAQYTGKSYTTSVSKIMQVVGVIL